MIVHSLFKKKILITKIDTANFFRFKIKQYLTFLLTISSVLLFGQKNEIEKKISESIGFVKASKTNIDSYDSFLMEGVGKTIRDAKYYFRKARNSVDDAIDDIKAAKSKVYEAKYIANSIECNEVETYFSDVERDFKKAIDDLEYVSSYLRNADYSDDHDNSIMYIKKSRKSITDAMEKILEAVKKLNKIREKLIYCD